MQLANTPKTKKNLYILALICATIHLGIAPNLSLGLGVANACLIFAFCATTALEGTRLLWVCFIAGLFFDLTTTGPVGLMSFELLCIGFLGTSEDRAHMGDDTLTIIKTFSLDCVVVTLVYCLAMWVVGDTSSFFEAIILKALPTCIITIIYFLPFLYVFSRSSSFGPSFSTKKKGLTLDTKTRGTHLSKKSF